MMNPETFRVRMTEMNISQARLAALWGMSEATVSRWTNGKTPIPAWVPYALAGIGQVETLTKQVAVDMVAKHHALTEPTPPAKPVQVEPEAARPPVFPNEHTANVVHGAKPPKLDVMPIYKFGRRIN